MHANKSLWIAVLTALWAIASASPVAKPNPQAVAPTDPPAADGEDASGDLQPGATPAETTGTEAVPTEGSTVPADAAATPVGTEDIPAQPTTEVPLSLGGTAAPAQSATAGDTGASDLEANAPPFQSVGVGQANAASLIAEAMAALDSLKQIAFPGLAACSTPGINSINNIPVDNGGDVTTHNVTIGDGGTRFTPAIIKARAGDTIMFNWVGKNNHSVTESDALGSCTKSTSPTAFDSGVQPPGTVWNLTLPANARGLKFFYCKVAMHCAKTGMSGTIITPE